MHTICIVLSIFIVILLSGDADAVTVYLDETKTEYVQADNLDCNVYEGKKGITIGFKAGNMLFSFGPEVTFGEKNEIKWDESVHSIIARYKEVCTRFNSGAVTMKEYNSRIEEIDSIAKEMLDFQERRIDKVKAEAKEAFRELDRETRDRDFMAREKTDVDIQDINNKIKALP